MPTEESPTVTIRGVELMSAGTHNASTGRSTVTADHIASCVEAYNDKFVDRPQIKIGHRDPRFPAEFDGEPAMGWITNVRSDAAGEKLIGDLSHVPRKLARIMPAAFRRRSAEIQFGVETNQGKRYPAVLTGIALLGATRPAVKDLADVYALYGVATVVEESAAFLIDDGDTEKIPDPSEFASDSEPTAAHIRGGTVGFTKTQKSALGLKEDASDDDVVAAVKNRAKAGRSKRVSAADGHELTAEEIAAEDAAFEMNAEIEAAAEAERTAEATRLANLQTTNPAAVAATTGDPNEIVTMTRAALEAIQSQAAQGAQAFADGLASRRDGIIATAAGQGKLHPDNVKHYRDLLDVDEAKTVALLSSLTPMFPVTEIGSPLAPEAFADGDLDDASQSMIKQLGLSALLNGGRI